MDLTPYVAKLRGELAVAAEAGGEEARALADRLTAPLESAIRLTLMEALSAAADEITGELAPGSVDLRLRGLEPTFVVNTVPADRPAVDQPPHAPTVHPSPDDSVSGDFPSVDGATGDKGATSRINLRLPDDLKVRIEDAAGRERLSVNTWLVRAAARALEPAAPQRASGHHTTDTGERFTGWVR